MSNAFLQLPVPVGNGVGAAVDVTSLSSTKTILIAGAFDAIVSVETSSDGGATFGPINGVTTQSPKPFTVPLSATHMRVRIANRQSGTPVVFVGSAVTGTSAAILDVPTTDGSGALSDIHDFPHWLTIVVAGQFGGSLNIEISDDDVNWSPLAFFNGAGVASLSCFAKSIRVTRSGVGFDPNVPVIAIAASDDSNAQATPAYVDPPEQIIIYARLAGNDDTGDGSLLKPYRTFERALRDGPLMAAPGVTYQVNITGLGDINLPASYMLPAFKSPTGRDFFNFTNPLSIILTGLTIQADPVLTTAIPAADAEVLNPGDFTYSYDIETGNVTIVLTGAPRASWGGDSLKGKKLFGAFGFDDASVIASSTETTLELCGERFPSAPLQIMDLSAKIICGGLGIQSNSVDSIQYIGIEFENPDFGPGFQSSANAGFALTFCDVPFPALGGRAGDASIWFYNYITRRQGIECPILIFASFLEDVNDDLTLSPLSGFAALRNCILERCSSIGSRFPTSYPSSGVMQWLLTGCEVRNSIESAVAFTGGNCDVSFTRIYGAQGDAINFSNGMGVMGLDTVTGPKTGTGGEAGDAISGPSAGVMTLTDTAADFLASMVGKMITIAGATTPANNGTFLVTRFISETQIRYANPAGVAEAFPGGASWIIGTENTGFGVQVQDGAQVKATATVSVSGAGGDLKVGSLAVTPWGSVTGVGEDLTGPVAGDMTIVDASAPFSAPIIGQTVLVQSFTDFGAFVVTAVGGGGTTLSYANPGGTAVTGPVIWGVLMTDPFNIPDYTGADATGSRASQVA